MDATASGAPGTRRPVAEVLRLAWPAFLSYLLNSTYRINDQFWIQGLGPAAQAAMGAMTFVAIMAFSVFFLSAGGALSLVARHEGAGDAEERDRVSRHAVLMALVLGGLMMVVGPPLIPWLLGLLDLTGTVAGHAAGYLEGFFAVAPAMVLILAIDHTFIGRGRTVIPMLLQLVAVACNFLLNPVLIYGTGMLAEVEAAGMPRFPGLALLAALAEWVGLEGFGLEGAAWATGLSRAVAGLLGLAILKWGFRMDLWFHRPPSPALLGRMLKIALPVSWSIAVYAGVYWALFALVLDRLDDAVKAGLAIGFQVFEGLAFPSYLGIAMAGSSLVGRSLGAKDRAACLTWVRAVRRTGYTAGLVYSLVFWFGGPVLVGLFTEDPDVTREVVLYTSVLAFSQLFVAVETVNEKILLGSGHTAPIAPITFVGNVVRVPLAMLLATGLGWGAAGVWWAINLSTYLKAFAYRRVVERGRWLDA